MYFIYLFILFYCIYIFYIYIYIFCIYKYICNDILNAICLVVYDKRLTNWFPCGSYRKYVVFYFNILKNTIYLCDAKLSFHQPILQSSVSHDSSEITIIC